MGGSDVESNLNTEDNTDRVFFSKKDVTPGEELAFFLDSPSLRFDIS
jgi:hypothetical protein